MGCRRGGFGDNPSLTAVRGFAAWSLAQAGPAAALATRDLVASADDPDPGVRGLAFLGFPLHPPGKPSTATYRNPWKVNRGS